MPSSGWMRMVMTLGWISPQSLQRAAIEDHRWRLLELDGDLGERAWQALAGADVEGNACPAPVVDFELEGGIGLGAGLGVDAVFLAVAEDVLAIDWRRGRTGRGRHCAWGWRGWPARL